MSPTSCPPFESLSQFRLGLLPESDVPGVEEHLRSCESCLKRLPPSQGDVLVQGLLGQHKRPRLSNPLMEELRQELRAKKPTPIDAPNHQTVGDASNPSTPTLVGSDEVPAKAQFDFLEPPQQAGELGRLGTYRVLHVLGEGGMGMVLQAHDTKLDRNVALKVMKKSISADPMARKRFEREARAQAALTHDHIITIHHIGEINETPFLAMPLLAGETLDQRLKREEVLPSSEVLRIGRQTAEALAAAHAKDLIHRDIKPANLWLEAPSGRVKVLDFGLASMPCPEGDKTLPGTILGTPGYMAPEQSENEANPKSDLFSLGCVLYRMATGRPAFDADSPLKKLRSVLVDTPEAPITLNPSLSKPFSDLVMRLLSKKPEDRPATATAVARVLETLAGPAREAIRAPVARIVKTPAPSSSPELPAQEGITAQKAPSQEAMPTPYQSDDKRMLYMIGGGAAVLLLVGLGMLFAWWMISASKEGSNTEAGKQPPREKRKPGAPQPVDISKQKPEHLEKDTLFRENWVINPPKVQDLKGWTIQPRHIGALEPMQFHITNDKRLFVYFYARQQGLQPYWWLFDPSNNGLKRGPFGGTFNDVSADGRTAIRCVGGAVEIWVDSRLNRPKNNFFHSGSFSAKLSPNAQRIAITDATSWARHVWITNGEGSELGKVTEGNQRFSYTHYEWSPDSTTLAIQKEHYSVALIREPWQKVTATLPQVRGWQYPRWSPDSKYLALVEESKKVKVLDVDGGKVIHEVTGYGVVTPAEWSPDGRELAFGTKDKKVVVWDLAKKKATFEFSGHTRDLYAVAFLPDQRTLVSGSKGSCRFWNLEKNVYRGALLLNPSYTWLTIGPDGNYNHSPGAGYTFVIRTRNRRGEKEDFSANEFYDRFGQKNDPTKIKLTDLPVVRRE